MCECEDCGAAFSERRAALGYMVITNRAELAGINNKVVPT